MLLLGLGCNWVSNQCCFFLVFSGAVTHFHFTRSPALELQRRYTVVKNQSLFHSTTAEITSSKNFNLTNQMVDCIHHTLAEFITDKWLNSQKWILDLGNAVKRRYFSLSPLLGPPGSWEQGGCAVEAPADAAQQHVRQHGCRCCRHLSLPRPPSGCKYTVLQPHSQPLTPPSFTTYCMR